jgi:hypothetical protein
LGAPQHFSEAGLRHEETPFPTCPSQVVYEDVTPNRSAVKGFTSSLS